MLPPPSTNPCDPSGANYYHFNSMSAAGAESAGVTTDVTIPGVTTKEECCQACYDPTSGAGCLGYYTQIYYDFTSTDLSQPFTGFTKELTCHVFVQDSSGPSGTALDQPWPAQCPYGGYPLQFSGQGQGSQGDVCANCNADLNCYFAHCQTFSGSVYDGTFASAPVYFYDAEPGFCNVGV